MRSTAAAGAVGGKSARACDSCLRRRARWYCAADDAFLCQACDATVHSPNPLARRHERLLLRPLPSKQQRPQVTPAWSRRKARSRRPHVKSIGQLLSRNLAVVPEVPADSTSEQRNKADEEDGSEEEEEEQLLYHHVPRFDRAFAQLCSPPPVDDGSCCRDGNGVHGAVENTSNKKDPAVAATTSSSPVQQLPDGGLAGFGPTDAELREFAADMEALLGQGLDDSNELDESLYMENLGLMTPASEDGSGREKTEPDAQFLQRSLDLRLNYEAVIESWGASPWTDGQRPNVRLDDFWPHHAYHSGAWAAGGEPTCGGGGPPLTPRWGADGCREARVSRYREKRRTRLFAKKIRYEVRKLNAEKRPRMKGRFVKRPAAGGGAVTT